MDGSSVLHWGWTESAGRLDEGLGGVGPVHKGLGYRATVWRLGEPPVESPSTSKMD